MAEETEAGTSTFTTPSDREIAMTRVFRRTAPAGLRGAHQPRASPSARATRQHRVVGSRLARDADLSEEDGQTTLTSTMLFPSKAARDAVLATGMKNGTRISHDRLADHLSATV
jgi:hypothetical protein